MTGEGFLQTLAEVSITLAGFSALISVFRQRAGSAWRPEGLMAMRGVIELSLLPVLFALLPFPLFYSGLTESAVWRVCSALAIRDVGFGRRLAWLDGYTARRSVPRIGNDRRGA